MISKYMKLSYRITLFFVVVLIIGVSSALFYKEGILPADRDNKTVKLFVIKPGENLNLISNRLESEHLIRSKLVFFVVVKQLGIEKKIQYGDFRLSPSMSAREIAKEFTVGSLDKWVTVQEGLRREEIAQIMSAELGIPEVEFEKASQGLEGYLFPDTYLIPKTASADDAVAILKNNFENRYSPEMKAQARKKGLTDLEIITLASIVEREARLEVDRPKVASIILRRIKEGHPLEVDATIQYALGYQPGAKTWWKGAITNDDKESPSLYNTYKRQGLPPGPISNPGLSSIQAALSADPTTPYLFYVADSKGRTYYGRTFEEHQQNIKKYCDTCN